MDLHHLVARTRFGVRALEDPRVCAWLWSRLRERFPDAAACGLMPDHVHLASSGPPDELRLRLARTLRWVTRRFFEGRELWDAVPDPELVPNAKHLLRQIRYIHLNPCRDGLARDPLEWEWSTHRDWTGVVVDPWVDVARWSKELGWPAHRAAERMHRYVSGDPSVRVEGTPLLAPVQLAPIDLPARLASPRLVSRAVEIATRAEEGSAGRKGALRVLAIQLTGRYSGLDSAQLGRALGISSQAVRKVRARAVPSDLEAKVIRILSDDRLLTGGNLRGVQVAPGATYEELVRLRRD